MKLRKTVLAIPDLHWPWADKSIVDQIVDAVEGLRPDVVIQLGDLYDFYAQSSFPKHPEISPKDEVRLGRAAAEEMWHRLVVASPKSKRIQLKGNHDVRPAKRLVEKAPELASFCNLHDIFVFPKVETIHDPREAPLIDGVMYIHGHMSKPNSHMHHYQNSVVRGHSHMGSCIFENTWHGHLFELSCGYAADPTSVPMSYTHMRSVKWCHGFGVVNVLGPRFVPLKSKKGK